MEQITHSPLPQQHGRRIVAPCQPGRVSAGAEPDSRWKLLDLVRICREPLRLRDRDIAVLRGLLSLLPPNPQDGLQMVFASNRVLIARCDGIDERTLRRRINHLQKAGLVTRAPSPNGKRYQVRNSEAGVELSYGISMAPLFALHAHLTALAESCAAEALRVKAMRALIRDRLFHNAGTIATKLQETARLALRRKLSADALHAIAIALPDPETPAAETASAPVCRPEEDPRLSREMTGRDGQNDRHIQRSVKESFDSDYAQKSKDLTIDEFLELASTVKDYLPSRPGSWSDLIRLAETLAPAIGLTHRMIGFAKEQLGRQGCALVILGLVQAFERIRSPGAYLNVLLINARNTDPDPVRIFHSLVKPAQPASCLQ